MSKIVDIINKLPELLPLKPATEIAIKDAEIQLRVSFNEESAHRKVITQTKKEHELNPKVPNTMYVIENTGVDGIIIWQDTAGAIYQSAPNVEPKKIADSLSAYLSSHM